MPSFRSSLLAVALVVVVAGVPGLAGAEPPDTSGTPALDGAPLCGAEAPAPETPVTVDDEAVRVASFNLLHSDTDDGDRSLAARLPLEIEAIVESGADIVGSQEVARNGTLGTGGDEYPQKHGTVAQRVAQGLAVATGTTWEWCWSMSSPHVPGTPDVNVGGGNPLDEQAAAMGNFPNEGDFREGLAIFTRFHISAARFRRLLPRSYEAAACVDPDPFCRLDATFDSRQVLWARVQAPEGPLDMFTTHIAHEVTPLSDTTKLLQVHQDLAIIDQWATADSYPDFLVGDFNSTPATDRYAAMIDAGFVDTYRAAGGVECAAPGDAGCSGGPADGEEVWTPGMTRAMSERIDYVFARPPVSAACVFSNPGVIGAQASPQADGRYLWPSDHLGFVSEIAC